jgi:hypothetical protein
LTPYVPLRLRAVTKGARMMIVQKSDNNFLAIFEL